MKLIIDGETISDDLAGIASAIDMARDKAGELGRLIIEINADGRPAGELLDTLPEDSAGVNELGIVTADKGAFLRETLHNGLEALDLTNIHQAEAATLLDQGKVHEALASLQPVVEGWQTVRTIASQGAMLMGVELQTLSINGTSAGDIIAGLAEDLVALRDAVSNEDWSALGDVLGYDLKERTAIWQSFLQTLIDLTSDSDTPEGNDHA
ncbi:MAG: hypothetical protein AB8F26_08515 [Phycisphaerales bacterium]